MTDFSPKGKPTVITDDPFSYNFTVKKDSEVDKIPLPTAQTLIAMQPYSDVSHYFNVGTVENWNKVYEKVFRIIEWVKERSDAKSGADIIKWLENNKPLASDGQKKIDYFYTRIKNATLTAK